ncbi:hypothetical protein J4E85_009527 [Alternaria conjuncta]|uniref:uncharacterized protein n=1 Tax=Alternaria conjuncta TaxID=181017 RepID=UPI00221F7966|nr:uncharacterized protein J4E85_009527 [Alternaria conjuncta]KAI4919269.1 hypothetical protein J4E85_009527 [Alternaria conjuncta]
MSVGAKSRRSQLEDSTHTHFTERVLGKVRDVLRPTSQPSATAQQTDTIPSLSDRLASLSTSDTDETDTISEEPFKDLTPVHIDFDDKEVEDEFWLAIDVFLEDLFFVRQYVKDIWTTYKESVMENNVCSLLTNTAIDVIRLAEKEFDRLVKRPKRFPADVFPVWTLPSLLFYKRTPTLDTKFTPEQFASLDLIKLPRYDSEDQSDFALFSVMSGLKWYLRSTRRRREFDPNPSKLDPTVFKQPGEDWHPYLPRVVEMCHLMQWQAWVKSVAEGKYATIAEDEIARGVRYVVEHKQIPIWVQFAAQTYIDIQDVLGDRLDAPLKELRNSVQVYDTILDQFLQVNSEVDRYESNPKFREGAVKTMNVIKLKKETLGAWFTKDVVSLPLPSVRHPYLSRLEHEDHVVLRRHPLGCGVFQYNMFLDLHEYGLQLEKATNCIRPMVYLYAATRLLCKDSPTWPDMELLIFRQDPKRLFYGHERPASYHRTFEYFVRACNTPITSLYFTDPSMLTDIFMDRFDHQVRDSEEIDLVVSKWATLMRSEEGMRRLLRQTNVNPSEYTAAMRSLQVQAKNNKPDEILSRLSPCIEADAIDLHFDWLTLHNTCARIWTRLYTKLASSRRAGVLSFDLNQFRNTYHPQASLVAQILLDAVHAYNTVQNLELRDSSCRYGAGIRDATSVIQEMIQRPMSSSPHGQIMTGDCSIARTMDQASQQGVYYPGMFYERLGPMNINKLYRGWDKKIMRGLHSTKLVKLSDAKYKAFVARREVELRRQHERLMEEFLQAIEVVRGQVDGEELWQAEQINPEQIERM